MRRFVVLVVVLLTVALLWVPTAQLMSLAPSGAGPRTLAKSPAGSARVAAVLGAAIAPVASPLVVARLTADDAGAAAPGFFAAPFVPPRA